MLAGGLSEDDEDASPLMRWLYAVRIEASTPPAAGSMPLARVCAGMNGMAFDPIGSSVFPPPISLDQLYRLATLPLRRQARGEVLREALCGISVAIVGRIVRKEIVVDKPSGAIETLLLTLANGRFLHVSLSIKLQVKKQCFLTLKSIYMAYSCE